MRNNTIKTIMNSEFGNVSIFWCDYINTNIYGFNLSMIGSESFWRVTMQIIAATAFAIIMVVVSC